MTKCSPRPNIINPGHTLLVKRQHNDRLIATILSFQMKVFVYIIIWFLTSPLVNARYNICLRNRDLPEPRFEVQYRNRTGIPDCFVPCSNQDECKYVILQRERERDLIYFWPSKKKGLQLHQILSILYNYTKNIKWPRRQQLSHSCDAAAAAPSWQKYIVIYMQACVRLVTSC